MSMPLWFFSCSALSLPSLAALWCSPTGHVLPVPVYYHGGDPEQQSEVKSGGWLTPVVERWNMF